MMLGSVVGSNPTTRSPRAGFPGCLNGCRHLLRHMGSQHQSRRLQVTGWPLMIPRLHLRRSYRLLKHG